MTQQITQVVSQIQTRQEAEQVLATLLERFSGPVAQRRAGRRAYDTKKTKTQTFQRVAFNLLRTLKTNRYTF